jgi:hypothetical protein
MKSFSSLTKDDIMSKAIVFIFEDIENLNHPLYLLIEQLRFNLSLLYERQIIKDDLEVMDKYYKNMISQIVIICVYLTEALIRFYDIRKNTNSKLYEVYYTKMRDILIRKDLYRILLKYKEKLLDDEINLYKDSLLKFFNIKPNRLGINPYFSLDTDFQQILLDNSLHKMESLSTSINSLYIPFQSSIQKYRKIIEYDSILMKIDKIYELRASILSEIDYFWKDVPLDPNLKKVDANNFQSIFIYIVIKGQLDSMLTEITLIDDILSSNSKLSEKGYFYTLIQSAMEYLINSINEEVLDNFEKEYNDIVNKVLNLADSNFIN